MPYQAVVIALHGLVVALAFVIVRRQSGPSLALGAAIVLVLFGSGFENLYWGFQTGFVGATAAGLAAFLAFDDGDVRRRGPLLLAALLTVGLATAGVALAFLVAIGVEAVLTRRSRRTFIALAVPAVVYAVWFVAFGRSGVTTRSPLSVEALLDVPGAIVTGFGNAAGALTGLGRAPGVAVASGWRSRPSSSPWRRQLAPRFVGCAAGIATLYGLIGLTRAHQFEGILDYTRYTYVGAIFLLVGVSAARPDDLPEPGRRRLWFVPVAWRRACGGPRVQHPAAGRGPCAVPRPRRDDAGTRDGRARAAAPGVDRS